MKRIVLFAVVIFSFAYQACNNEIDLLDDYKESIVCYGILNPKDTAHYIRVSKVFLGEGNALVFAQNQDSIQLRPEDMEVRITRLLNGNEMSYWILQPDSSIPRDPGIFLYPEQILYRGAFPVLTDGSTYLLTVTNLRTGFQVKSETPVVKDVVQTSPASTMQAINLEDETTIGFYFKAPRFGKSYQLVIRFFYDEQFIYDTTEVSTKYVDWYIGQTESLTDLGNENLTLTVRRDNFMRMLVNNIEINPMVRRVSKSLSFIYTSASEDIYTYMQVQNANNNSSADLPAFSNIENGMGLFTTRNTTTLPNYRIDSDTQYALATSSIVDDLNFVR